MRAMLLAIVLGVTALPPDPRRGDMGLRDGEPVAWDDNARAWVAYNAVPPLPPREACVVVWHGMSGTPWCLGAGGAWAPAKEPDCVGMTFTFTNGECEDCPPTLGLWEEPAIRARLAHASECDRYYAGAPLVDREPWPQEVTHMEDCHCISLATIVCGDGCYYEVEGKWILMPTEPCPERVLGVAHSQVEADAMADGARERDAARCLARKPSPNASPHGMQFAP